MESTNKEGIFPYEEPSPEPPTLIEDMFDFGHILSGSSKTLQQVITNTTRKPMIWLADVTDASWLTLEPDHGVLQSGERLAIRVTADTRFLTVGEHTVTVTFSSEGDNSSMSSNMMGKISVVKDENGRQADATTAPLPLQAGLNFGALTPLSTNTLMLVINNPDNRQVKWEIQIGAGKAGSGTRRKLEHGEKPPMVEPFDINQVNGVTVSESNGSLPPHKSTTIFVTANAAKLPTGYAYMTDLTLISSVDGASTAVEIPVDFYVRFLPFDDGGPKAPPFFPPHITVTIEAGEDSGQALLNFPNNNDKMINWEVVSDVAWLVPNQLSGTLDAHQMATVILTAERKRKLAEYSTDLHLTLNWRPANDHATLLLIPVTVEAL